MLGEGNGDYNKAQKFVSILMVERAREYKWNINDNNSPEGDQTILAIAKPDSKSSCNDRKSQNLSSLFYASQDAQSFV